MIKTDNKTLNLSTYFMLPLLKINPKQFGKDNLENVYITTQMQVVVRVKNKEEVAYDYTQDVNFILDYDEDNLTTIIYNLPEVFADDFIYFTKGLYSKMTIFAKDEIKKYSGLVHMKFVRNQDIFDSNGKKVGVQPLYETHNYLRALDKCEVLRNHLETTLDIKISLDSELLDKVKDSEYIKL